MGTNFYLRMRACDKCGRYDELHIGELSFGWQFSFRAYDYEGAPATVRTFRDWLRILPSGRIFDEYGLEVPLDEFLTLVERKRKEPRNHAALYPGQLDFVDPEGYSFTKVEFS